MVKFPYKFPLRVSERARERLMKAKNTSKSKELRKNQTPWESKVWYYLRKKNFSNLKFKRQVPIGEFIVDFCCQRLRLIIELDGGYHADTAQRMKDFKRDKWMKNKGYTILRFWNNEVDNNIEGVLEKILETITSL